MIWLDFTKTCTARGLLEINQDPQWQEEFSNSLLKIESADEDCEIILRGTAITGLIRLDYIVTKKGEVFECHKTVNF